MDTKQRTPGGSSQQRKRVNTVKPAGNRQTKRRATQSRRSSSASGKAARSASVRTVQRRPTPDVVYTPPKPFSRGRMVLHLATVVAVVLALTFSMSIFFKVENVTVSGAQKYTAWQVREASGIVQGDNLITFGKAKACGKITTALPYVDTVRIGIKLPDTVNIEITEIEVVYAIKAQDESWWLITADGEVVEKTNSATAGDYTKILGVRLAMPQPNAQATAYEPPAAQAESEDATVPVTIKASEQLSAALSIVQYLEANGIIGEAVSVDVTDMANMEVWYGTQYLVKLGDTTQLGYKISAMEKAISQMDNYHSGELDVSFTLWPEEVGYTPFT